MLQRVAACCSVLQCAVSGGNVRCAAVCCSVLQCVAVCCIKTTDVDRCQPNRVNVFSTAKFADRRELLEGARTERRD